MVVRTLGLPALVVVVLAVVGCSSKPPPPTKITGMITAAEALNPDPGGRPSPVVMRIYHLKSATAFESADFFSLYGDATGVLKDDLIATEEFMIRPGQAQAYEAEFDAEARFVGVMSAYRDLGGGKWRDVVALPEDKMLDFLKRKKLAVRLENTVVDVTFE